MGLPRHSLGAGVMKSSSWGTSWLYFAGVRRRRRASCNGKILNSPATHGTVLARRGRAENRGLARRSRHGDPRSRNGPRGDSVSRRECVLGLSFSRFRVSESTRLLPNACCDSRSVSLPCNRAGKLQLRSAEIDEFPIFHILIFSHMIEKLFLSFSHKFSYRY